MSARNGCARFVARQTRYNLIYREEAREMNRLCEEEGIAVIPWSPLARGLLAGTRKSLDDKEATVRAGDDTFTAILYNEPTDWDVVEAVKKVAGERGVPAAQISLAWLLSKSAVTAPIVGATKMEHLEDAIASVDRELTEEEIQTLEAPYRGPPATGMFS